LADAVRSLAHHQTGLGLPSVDPPVVPFFNRPFLAVGPEMSASIAETITDPLVRRLPRGVGTIEQWVTSVDILSHPARRASLVAAYRAILGDR
jgi:hypothetical protein